MTCGVSDVLGWITRPLQFCIFEWIDQAVLDECIKNRLYAVSESNRTQWCEAVRTIYDNVERIAPDSAFDRSLKRLSPWRKGPFQLGEVVIDSEWDCRLKWERLLKCGISFKDKRIADIGAGNGYYMTQLALHDPSVVIGLDPTLLFLFQFLAIQSVYQLSNTALVPMGFQDLSHFHCLFDVILCMGVLYHHRYPQTVLSSLYQGLSESGTLILETLVIDGDGDQVLMPQNRYANMRNVYHIPTVSVLISWVHSAGFKQVSVVDISQTTSLEQRATEWSSPKSLRDFLDPLNPNRTIEGYPGPIRAMLKCQK